MIPLPGHDGQGTRWPASARHAGTTLGRAFGRFWRHGDLFPAAAISFYAIFSLLPLAILLLVSLQLLFPADMIARNVGRVFGGLSDTDILIRTIRDAYNQHGRLGWLGGITLIAAAAGVFTAVQVALNRVWEVPGRHFHLQFLIGVLMVATSLLVFLGMLVLLISTLRFLRFSEVGALLGHPRLPRSGPASFLSVVTSVAQFGVFWVGYKVMPNVRIRWRDAWLGALVATILWHVIAIGIGWYLEDVADYSTLYHQVQALIALLVWVYALACCFLFGAEFVVESTPYPHVVREAVKRPPADALVRRIPAAAGDR
ncbi:MAG TPA: YihY/virulence factor BrkB family protein [bacterium]|nr:YihY/virulence factor BrkB family protein [bacterium]